MAKARITITPKKAIMDAQGQTVERALQNLGYRGVSGVRIGKYVEMEVSEEAKGQVDEMCRRLLANPIIEDFEIRIEE
jgi:phosphoribosylformylglycinamidine synthase subunit PurS